MQQVYGFHQQSSIITHSSDQMPEGLRTLPLSGSSVQRRLTAWAAEVTSPAVNTCSPSSAAPTPPFTTSGQHVLTLNKAHCWSSLQPRQHVQPTEASHHSGHSMHALAEALAWSYMTAEWGKPVAHITWGDLPKLLQLKGGLMGWVPFLQAVKGVAQHWEVLCRAACLCWGERGSLRRVHWGQTFACRAPSPTSSQKLQLQIVIINVC